MKLLLLVRFFVTTTTVQAQSLLNATARYPQLSSFNELLSTFPDLAAGLLTNISTSPSRQTILVPSNDAFDNYQQQNGASVSSLSSSDVGNILNYHTLQGALSSSDIQQPNGLVSETALRDSTYATRENATDAGDSLPQVVYISSTETATGRKIKARQISALSSVDVRSGRGNEIELEQTPGNWSGGVFFVVNGFLTLPVNQTDTMTSANLTSFVRGLVRTDVADGTNAARGLTCVCPSNQAFEAISNNNGNLTDGFGSLLATLTRHGLTGSYYTTNFTDGDMIQSQNGYPILVTRRNGSIFLNDARLVGSNYIANSGSVHALDRIMGFLNTTTNETTPANAAIYSDPANIPTPPPTPSVETSSGGVIPTSNATGNQIVPSATETGGSGPAASGTGAAETGSTEGTSAASSSRDLCTWAAFVGTAFVMGILAL
ncbi:MAG: hypothetical protein L6R38_007829 [Xanthoria sp. 2 TBL-2021]|nr:MAG: hypothetical protein L6R38_007829 [Xanthoria sp. 2 TBL-2021]